MTTIQDKITYYDGSVATGKIVVTWPPFDYGGVSIAAGQQEYPIALDGTVVIECYPCVGAQPIGTYYTATYELDKGATYDEYWMVPAASATTIGAIRVSVPETPSIMINAQQLTSSGAQSGMFLGWNGSNWVPMYTGEFNAPVSSVFTRMGAVIALAGDYTAAMVTNAVSTLGSYADPAWITSLAYAKITGAPAAGAVSSVFTRTGAIVATMGDYTAAMITNAVSTLGSYADPAWITSLAYAKITGAPSGGGGSQTPWQTNIDAATKNLTNVGQIAVGNTAANYDLEIGNALIVKPGSMGFGIGVSSSIKDSGMSFGQSGFYFCNWKWVYNATPANAYALIDCYSGNPLFLQGQSGGKVGVGSADFTPTHLLQVRNDDAAKPTTSTWIIASDSRLKRNIKDLEGGLEVIKQLRPIEAEFNGLHDTPEGQRVVSFLAEEIRKILPGTVGSRRGKLRKDDAEETDILDFNLHEVLIHLVLAVKQLAAKAVP